MQPNESIEMKQAGQLQQCDCDLNVKIDIQKNGSNELQKIPFPKQVFFIIGSEFCERFTFFGMSAILVLYLNEKMGYSENDASALYHGFIMILYLLCIPGGIIADVWLGKFKTILCFSIFYVFGCAAVSMSAFPNIGMSPRIVLVTGLLLIAVGSGGIKSSVSAFGGDQFKLPEQAVQMATYFSIFYFSISLGSVLSTTLTPILRSDVHCFGENDCYALAFGVPAILMILAITFFLIGKSSYTIVKISSENKMVQVIKCISNAIVTRFREGHCSPRKNLLDYSTDKYGEQLVKEVRTLLRILVLFLPLPIYWTISAQSGSRWTFQAKKMNGNIGFYRMKADQIQMVGAPFVLILIPLFETIFYPLLRRVGIQRPLQKMTIGGIFSALAFAFAGVLQLYIEAAPEKSVHMFWQLPQHFLLAIGEVMVQVIGLDFSYNEAPLSLKTVIISFWLLCVSLGNLITLVFISSVHIFEYQSHEFLFFAGLMLVDVLIFAILAYFYKSTNRPKEGTISVMNNGTDNSK